MTGSTSLDVKLRVGEAGGDGGERQRPDRRVPRASWPSTGCEIELFDYVEHTLSARAVTRYAAAYVELQVDGKRLWGVGIDADISTASLKAVVSAVNRAVRADAADRELIPAG